MNEGVKIPRPEPGGAGPVEQAPRRHPTSSRSFDCFFGCFSGFFLPPAKTEETVRPREGGESGRRRCPGARPYPLGPTWCPLRSPPPRRPSPRSARRRPPQRFRLAPRGCRSASAAASASGAGAGRAGPRAGRRCWRGRGLRWGPAGSSGRAARWGRSCPARPPPRTELWAARGAGTPRGGPLPPAGRRLWLR